jgi:Asp-tRNA(Asn)/Glu-tRNA(Gln) amidotransferase A subunit family amidase
MTNTTTDWQTIASTYKARLYGSIPPDWRLPKPHHLPQNVHDLVKQSNLLTARELEINNLDATDLRDALAEQVYTALEVTTTYLKAAAVAQQATNCLMDYFPAEALERAQWLDDEMKRTGRPIGPLHGVPISVKGEYSLVFTTSTYTRLQTKGIDHLALKGHEITSGYASWVGKEIPEKDSTIIALLRAAGAGMVTRFLAKVT